MSRAQKLSSRFRNSFTGPGDHQMSIYRGFDKETYSCERCNTSCEHDDVVMTWKCPRCDQFVLVQAENHLGDRMQIYRIKASKVTVGRMVMLSRERPGDSHEVLDVRTTDRGWSIVLRGYGTYDVTERHLFLNCIEGSW